jgi:sugar phosphate permease
LLAELYGWPSIFYFTGTMGILWSIFWFYFCFDSPSVHPTITDNEKDYISQSTGENDDKSQ